MTQLPLDQAIPRFKGNEERVDKLVNGTDLEVWTTENGVVLPTFAKFLKDKEAEYDLAISGPVARAETAAIASEASAVSADASADEAAAILAEIQAGATNLTEKIFTGTGAQVNFTLDRSPSVDENVLVWVGGSIQDTLDYSVLGPILTFNTPPPMGVKVRTLIIGLITGNEVADLVTEAQEAAAAASLAADRAEGFLQNINPMAPEFGAIGNNVADDYPAMEAACRAAEGRTLFIPAGTYRMISGSPRVGSNTIVVLSPNAVIVQPNYFSYNRPTAPYVRANVVDWNGFWMINGTKNVYFLGGGAIRGPFWQPNDAAYAATPTQNWPASNGIFVRGNDYQYRKSLPLLTEVSDNIRIENIRIEGFGDDAIQLDQVTNVFVNKNILLRNGRGGIRCTGTVTGEVFNNTVKHIYPGDYLNRREGVGGTEIGGSRMYGFTATRVYIAGSPASENIKVMGNTFEDIPFWKGADTHGGINIWFLYNKCYNCHIGIGVDKGGYDAEDGIFPPRNIWILGNRIIRTTPDNPNEGDVGVIGQAIQVFAHDATDAQVGRNIIIDDNICVGWGEQIRFGAVVVSNCIGVRIGGGNQILDSRRAAICIRERFEGVISDDLLIDDVRPSSLGVQDGIAIESGNAIGKIGDVTIINRQSTPMRGIYLNNPDANMGFKISDGLTFRKLGSGSITKVVNPHNEKSGPWTMRKLHMVRTQTDGTKQNERGDLIFNITNPSAGVYVYTFTNFTFTATSAGFPEVTTRVNGFRGTAEVTNTNEITVWMRNAAGADTNCSHILHIYGYGQEVIA